jgi:hypothetical protein
MSPELRISTVIFEFGIVAAVELEGSLVTCPLVGIILSASIIKKTNRKSMISIMGMISILGFFTSRYLINLL